MGRFGWSGGGARLVQKHEGMLSSGFFKSFSVAGIWWDLGGKGDKYLE